MESHYRRGEQSVLDWIKHHHADYAAKELTVDIKEGNPSAASFMKFQAFTTAAVQDQRVRDRIQQTLTDNLDKGQSKKDFAKVIDQEFAKAGLTKLNPHQIDNIYYTNTSLAFGAGQMGKMVEVSGDFPYWKYSATMDNKTRPSHAALHGKIFRTGDFTFWPPIGFRCRCTAIPLTARQAAAQGGLSEPLTADERNSLTNVEFIGNKNEKYMKWLAKEYAKADGETRGYVDKAIDELKKDIKAQYDSGQTIDYTNIIKAENKIRMNKSFETAVVFDQEGKEVFRKGGGAASVGFTRDEMALFKDTVFTHNHPRGWGAPEGTLGRIGSSFSDSDILTAIRGNVAEMRAVTPHYTFILKRPKNGWPNVGAIQTAYEMEQAATKKYMDSIIGKANSREHLKKEYERANAIFFHRIWKRVCKKNRIEYTKAKTRE